MRKKLIALALMTTMCTTMLTACGNSEENTGNSSGGSSDTSSSQSKVIEPNKAVQSTDNYRNFYQIFVNSFCDSDDDSIGDIPGIISKLDYLNDGNPESGDDLGIDGIWLTPIAESQSYHKYDVEDYCSIDSTFGTMKDFEKLIEECNKRGIHVITDLVVNHSSNTHEWFVKACEEVKAGNFDGYAKYYHIVEKENAGDGYTQIQGTDYYYESNFSDTMPELNLSNPDVREEIKKIMQFWFDKGVAGFRLDAIKYYDTGGDDGKEFCKWLVDTAHELKKDSYIVGENWSGTGTVSEWYKTGIDSQFNFPMSAAIGDYEATVRTGNVKKLLGTVKNWNETIKKQTPNAIDCSFLSNHDMVRSGASLGKDVEKEKMAAMYYMLAPGNPYIYYGEELGLVGSEKDNDGTYRLPMPWTGDEYDKISVLNVTPDVAKEAIVDTADKAQKDENSLFSTYKKLITLKLQNPEIARGTISKIVETSNDYMAGYVTEYDGKKVLVMYNGSKDKSAEATLDSDWKGIAGEVYAKSGSEKAKFTGDKLTLPPRSVVVIR